MKSTLGQTTQQAQKRRKKIQKKQMPTPAD
jgi:hypothetical protein